MKNRISILILAMMIVSSCADLDIENENDPNRSKVLAKPEDYKNLASGAMLGIANAFATTYSRGDVNLAWTADHTTMTNNVNNWWSEFKVEPRPAFNNTLANANLGAVVGRHWSVFNGVLSSAQTVISAIEEEGLEITDATTTQMVLATAYFAKAQAHGYLAQIHDKGYRVNNDTDLATVGLTSYEELRDQAIADLDKVIQICGANTFTLDAGFLPTPAPYTNVQLGKLANTYAAHYLMLTARTKAQNDANDWAKILAYANAGITEDYTHNDDNYYNGFAYGSGIDWYFRIDHRIIRTMDPAYPKRFPSSTSVTSIPAATSADKRLTKYFKYEANLASYNLTRGPQLRSHYRLSRWDTYFTAAGVGELPYYFKYMNDLMRAEAMVMANNNIAGAVGILNAGNRVTVGELPADLSTGMSKDEVLQLIWNERDIEECRIDWAISFCDARRRGILQKGVLYHFPVPATELAILNLPLYTYGGQSAADGVNTSNGVGAWYTPGE